MLHFNPLSASKRWILVARKVEDPTRKKKPPGLKKKKKLSRLTVSLLPWQEFISFLAGIFEKLEEIVVIDNQVVQPPVSRPLVQT